MNSWLEEIRFGQESARWEEAIRPKLLDSPYHGLAVSNYRDRTRQLLAEQSLDGPTLVEAVLESWEDIFRSQIGFAKIGRDIFPTPQIMGFLLHELVPARIGHLYPEWRKDESSTEKDLVNLNNPLLSIEIKTSSNPTKVFGNRSYGVETSGSSGRIAKKAKSGYYCTVNFEKWQSKDAAAPRPEVKLIRYGWIDSTDWRSQGAESGQQSNLPTRVYNHQLATLFVKK